MEATLISFWAYTNSGLQRKYKKEVDRLFQSAQDVGLKTREYNKEWLIKTKEYHENPLTFAQRGYAWAFKPLSILDALNKVPYGDVVIYSDSDNVLLKYPQDIVDIAVASNIYVHDHYPLVYRNRFWTNKQLFVKTGGDSEEYWNAPQLHANVIGFVKNDFTLSFVREWRDLACDYKVSVDTSEIPNGPEVNDNRYDQSILSILAVKHKIPVQTCSQEFIIEGRQIYA